MAMYNLYQLDALMVADSYPQSTRAQVEDYLTGHGLLSTDPTVKVDVEGVPGTIGSPSTAQVLLINPQQSETISTGPGSANPDLRYIVDPGNVVLTITGSNDIGISLTTGAETVTLSDSGNDVLYTGSGNEDVDGTLSTGNDSLYAAGSGHATIHGGSGQDNLIAYNGSGSGELISGSTLADSLPGSGTYMDDISSTAHTLMGGAGADTIYVAGSGGDLLEAGSGTQILATYGSGNNSLLGGAGADSLYSSSSGSDTLQGGSGPNYVIALASSGGGELISGSTSADTAAGAGNYMDDLSGAAHTLQGGAGADTIYTAGSGNDLIEAGSGANLIATFGSGNNSVVGGTGADSLYSNSTGSDTLHGGTGNNLLVALSTSGSGELISGSNSGGSNYLDDYSSTAHTLQGGGGADSLYGNNSSGDTLIAGSGNNQVLQVFQGDNLLQAGSGAGTGDSLAAGSGNDTLDGSGNSNFQALFSGTGNSTLDGGSATGSYGYFGIKAQGGLGADTVTINTGAASTTDYVDFTAGANYASTDATSGLPTNGSTNANVTLTFGSGATAQTVNINGSAGNTIVLEFTDQNITYHG